MKCFLRANSPEIRKKLEENGVSVCICCTFPTAEWISYCAATINRVHGVYPGDDEDEWGTEGLFGNGSNFKDVFLADHKDYVDCGEDVELFIETIKS